MAIYRGAGGAGDATGDSASEALLVRQLAAEVQIDADAAEAARAAAVTAQIAAELAETNAETAEANAETAETNAETAASSASSSASAAATSATNAANSATAAQTAETNAETAETNAAASASAASTSATNAASSASSASASASTATTQATNAANSATAAATSATNASNSASAAATSATNASNSATAASGSATSAASSASTATTQAGIATTQATNAAASASAASTSETNAASSASSASTSATNASNSASSAATSATNASNSATASASSASDAAASAAAAAASYDNFDDRYLGSKSSAPTLDNDGNALLTGALYYNNGTVTPADKGMYVYDGSQWIAASAASTAILTVYKYTATAGQTTFSGNDDNAVSLVYTAGSVIITLNGVVLEIPSEVTASSGTSVVLSTGAVAGDELNIYAFATFNVANTYTQAQSDATFLTKSNPSYTGTFTGGTGVVNIGSGQFYKDASGNLGIGTSSPLSIAGYTIQTLNNGTSGSGTYYQQAATSIGRVLVTSSEMYVGTNGAYPLLFQTNAAERMRIDSSGNVGIGTSSPAYKLEVNGGASAGFMRLASTANPTGFDIGVGGSGDPTAYIYNRNNTPLLFATNNTERMRIDSSGNLFIGKTASDTTNAGIWAYNSAGQGRINFIKGTESGTGATSTCVFYYNGTSVGSITSSSTATAYNTSSDYRLKDITGDLTGYKERIMALQPKQGSWKSDGSVFKGFIAHEFAEQYPNAVSGEKDAVDAEGKPMYQGMQAGGAETIADLVALAKEQQAIITDLRTELDSLKSEVTALKGQA